jgi:hypothetical protein
MSDIFSPFNSSPYPFFNRYKIYKKNTNLPLIKKLKKKKQKEKRVAKPGVSVD